MRNLYSLQDLTLLLEQYSVKGSITNNYLLTDSYSQVINNGLLYCIESKSNICLLIDKKEFYQLYFYLNNLNEVVDLDTDKPVTMEILYRGENQKPNNILSFWESCGFNQHLIRDNLTASFEQLKVLGDKDPDIEIRIASSETEASFTKELIDNTFDKFTGDILTNKEINTFVRNRNVLCAYWKGDLSGILQFEIRNNVVWLGHIAISADFRGKGIAKELVNAYISLNAANAKTRYILWVIQNNVAAKNLYDKFGFIYGNKSSASMLRK